MNCYRLIDLVLHSKKCETLYAWHNGEKNDKGI